MRQLRASGCRTDVLVLSAYSPHEIEKKCVDAGATRVGIKNGINADLVQQILAMVRR